MTDKQIIDGVDVSGCEWIREVGLDSEYICTCNSPNKTSGYCKDHPNCCYKELKAKQQECETLASQLDFEVQKKECLEQECEELKKDRERWKSNFNGKVSAIEELLQQLDQLKAENKELKEELEELKEENEYNETNAIEFKQTLTEIKEIVRQEIVCDDCNLQGTDKCDSRLCTSFYLDDFCKRLLQKISEVEE